MSYTAGDTLSFLFTTRQASGAPHTLAGSPAISCYKNGSTTQTTTGVSAISADFDGVTGLNLVTITTAADGTFYADGNDFHLVITTGTVNSINVVGEVVARFQLEEPPLRPITKSRKALVASGGHMAPDWSAINAPTTTVNLSGTTIKTATDIETDTQDIQSRIPTTLVDGKLITIPCSRMIGTTIATLTDQTHFTMTAGSADDDAYTGQSILITDQSTATQMSPGAVSDYVGSTKGVVLNAAPKFTIAVGDKVEVFLSDAAAQAGAIADAILDETLGDHNEDGSVGKHLNDITSSGGPIEQRPVADEFTVMVPRRSSTNLAAAAVKYVEGSEKVLFAVDFLNVLHEGDALDSITTISEDTGQSITLTPVGVCQSQAKFWVENVLALTYRIEVKVLTLFGLTLEGDFVLTQAD